MINNICGIYQIKNTVTNKLYIGSAEIIRERWVNHKSLLRRNVHHSIHLQNSWNKYGASAFVFSILEKCKKEELVFKEQFYLNTLLKADLFILKKSNYFITHGMNIKPVANAGFFGKHTEATILKMLKRKARPVLAIAPNGQILGNYISSGFAATANNTTVDVVRASIKNKSLNKKNQFGFMYEDIYERQYIPKKFIPHNKGTKRTQSGPKLSKAHYKKLIAISSKPVFLFNIYGEMIRAFTSHAECGRFLNMTSSGLCKKIDKVNVKHTSDKTAQYRIFKDRNNPAVAIFCAKHKQITRQLSKKGPVAVFRLDKKCVGYGTSVTNLANIFNVGLDTISKVIHGKRKQHMGYVFKKFA